MGIFDDIIKKTEKAFDDIISDASSEDVFTTGKEEDVFDTGRKEDVWRGEPIEPWRT